MIAVERALGDAPGHEFHGNQWTSGNGPVSTEHDAVYKQLPHKTVVAQSRKGVVDVRHEGDRRKFGATTRSGQYLGTFSRVQNAKEALEHPQDFLGPRVIQHPTKAVDETKWKHRSLGDAPGHEFHGNQWTIHGGKVGEAEAKKQSEAWAKQDNPLARPGKIVGVTDGVSEREAHRYVGAYGEEFESAKLPADVDEATPNQCYKNASLLVMERLDLTYAEGFAYTVKSAPILGVLHAWAVDKDNRVVDPTIKDPENWRYFGVKYDRAKYLKGLYTSKMYGVLGGTAKTANAAMANGGAKLR